MNELSYITPQSITDALVNLRQIVFEVTDACNLRCKYCGYGELYEGFDERENRSLQYSKAKTLLDYMSDIWDSIQGKSYQTMTYLSFYGGEPLLNTEFIKNIISYVEGLNLNRRFEYSMTTNAMLLDRHMDYLVQKQFHLLISFDGNEVNQSYRVDHAGNNSFNRVINNIRLLRTKYPDYFNSHVNFNSVLHNRNSVESVIEFIKAEFDKIPRISELNNSGIKSDKIEEFMRTYRNKSESLASSENYEKLSAEMFMEEPRTNDLLLFLHQYSGNVFRGYNELFYDRDKAKQAISGTCTPFSKKMFITATGKILQCERIDHQFALGTITDNGVELDINSIAERFNGYMEKLSAQCRVCQRLKSCIQCMYDIDGITGSKPVCQGFMNKSDFERYSSYCLSYLAGHPHLYQKLMTEVTVG